MTSSNVDPRQWYLNEPFQAFWEKSYRSLEVSGMGHPSFEVAEIAPVLPPNAKVLDLGCGEGRNALYLASIGCNVTAVDRSSAGIEKLNFAAECKGLNLETRVADIAGFPLEGQYDLIMAHGVLYYLENAIWKELLNRVREHTQIGGFNIFTVFVYSDAYPCPEEFQAAGYKHSFSPHELMRFYEDWELIRSDQYVKWDGHPDVDMHYHPIEKLVARKPGGKAINFNVQRIDIGQDADPDLFDSVSMGLQTEVLLKMFGNPRYIDKVFFTGEQFGVSHRLQSRRRAVLMKDYALELWYYGRHVFYIVDGEVTGKALYSSKPVKLEPSPALF